ncbi:MAG: hypothetical protein JWL82_15 [Parcubacteria group bacterium]|nr:hypothetical protein [Parcubacteria group bacterium]
MPKSWDINPAGAPARRSAPSRPQPVAAPRSVARQVPTRRESVRASAPPSRTPLKKQRQLKRRRVFVIFLLLALAIFVLVEVILWQSFLRVQSVKTEGPNANELSAFVLQDLSGTRYMLVPKNSIFFLPEATLRAHILAKFPNVEAVSISPEGLTTLAVTTTERSAVFWWCGASKDAPELSCYETDSQGLIFSEVPLDVGVASTSMLKFYAPLTTPLAPGISPRGSILKNPTYLTGVLQFVKAMKALNANVTVVDLRADEVDLYTPAGTRITYVAGREQQAVTLAASAFPSLSLNNGSLQYVDLRFEGKVFFKKKEDAAATSTAKPVQPAQ